MFVPMFDRIVIEPVKVEERKHGNLYLAPSSPTPYIKSKVIDVGVGLYLPDGKLRPLRVSKGDIVLHPEGSILEYRDSDETVKFICERDIIAKWCSNPVEQETEPQLLTEEK